MNFVKQIVNHRYELLIPGLFLEKAGSNLLDSYEPEHLLSMERLLKPGDITFVAGAETGWFAAIVAQFVGGGSVGLFEPADVQWPAIYETWRANLLPEPKLTYCGFLGSKSMRAYGSAIATADALHWQGGELARLAPPAPGQAAQAHGGVWPWAIGDDRWRLEYRSLKERGGIDIPVTTVDDIVQKTKIVPRALTIDVEGAEYEVLKGARNTMVTHHPLIWLSIHQVRRPGTDTGPLVYDYGSSRDEVLAYVRSLGYTPTFLEDSMDEQWLLE